MRLTSLVLTACLLSPGLAAAQTPGQVFPQATRQPITLERGFELFRAICLRQEPLFITAGPRLLKRGALQPPPHPERGTAMEFRFELPNYEVNFMLLVPPAFRKAECNLGFGSDANRASFFSAFQDHFGNDPINGVYTDPISGKKVRLGSSGEFSGMFIHEIFALDDLPAPDADPPPGPDAIGKDMDDNPIAWATILREVSS